MEGTRWCSPVLQASQGGRAWLCECVCVCVCVRVGEREGEREREREAGGGSVRKISMYFGDTLMQIKCKLTDRLGPCTVGQAAGLFDSWALRGYGWEGMLLGGPR